jgi:hypothetical protein
LVEEKKKKGTPVAFTAPGRDPGQRHRHNAVSFDTGCQKQLETVVASFLVDKRLLECQPEGAIHSTPSSN